MMPSNSPSRAGYAASNRLKTVLRKNCRRIEFACVGERVSGFSTANLWKNRSSKTRSKSFAQIGFDAVDGDESYFFHAPTHHTSTCPMQVLR